MLSVEAETGGSWIPGLAVLARNDGLVVFVIPAKAGIQGVWYGLGILFLSSGAKQSLSEKEIASSPVAPRNDRDLPVSGRARSCAPPNSSVESLASGNFLCSFRLFSQKKKERGFYIPLSGV